MVEKFFQQKNRVQYPIKKQQKIKDRKKKWNKISSEDPEKAHVGRAKNYKRNSAHQAKTETSN